MNTGWRSNEALHAVATITQNFFLRKPQKKRASVALLDPSLHWNRQMSETPIDQESEKWPEAVADGKVYRNGNDNSPNLHQLTRNTG